MKITIALAGNPNSGKTTLFNVLTGSHQYIGNWPGVTVEKKEGNLKTNKDIKMCIRDRSYKQLLVMELDHLLDLRLCY